MAEKLSTPEPLAPVQVAMIGGTGDGKPIVSGTMAQTPGTSTPNVVLTVVSPIVAILVRFAHSYLTILVALIGAGMTTDVIPAADFLALVVACGKLSLAGAGLGALKDTVLIFSRLEQKFPLTAGGV